MMIRIGGRMVAMGVFALGVLGCPTMAPCAQSHAAPPAADAPLQARVSVNDFILVDRAPVRNGFGPFSIEATGLLPAPRRRDDFTPTEDDHFYTLRRTVERFLLRKEIPVDWASSALARIGFGTELGRLHDPDGIAYAVEGELVVRGTSVIPLGLSLTAPADGTVLRYSVGLMVADQTVMMKEGLLDQATRSAHWMVALRPSGGDAALPVRAVFAVRAEGGGDPATNLKTLGAVEAILTSSSDGRPAASERSNDASEWLKPPEVFVKPGQVPGQGSEDAKPEHGGKTDKKPESGGHH